MFGMIGIRKSFQGVYWMGSFSYHVGQRIKKYRKSRGYTIEPVSYTHLFPPSSST